MLVFTDGKYFDPYAVTVIIIVYRIYSENIYILESIGGEVYSPLRHLRFSRISFRRMLRYLLRTRRVVFARH